MSETEKNFPIVTFDVHHELGSVGGRIAATGFLEHIACNGTTDVGLNRFSCCVLLGYFTVRLTVSVYPPPLTVSFL